MWAEGGLSCVLTFGGLFRDSYEISELVAKIFNGN